MSNFWTIAVPLFTFSILTPTAVVRPQNERHAWSKKGHLVPAKCWPSEKQPCKPLRIPSPDGKNYVEVVYGQNPDPNDSGAETASLTVIGSGIGLGTLKTSGGVEDEIVWAPDSTAFFINGSDNSYSDHRVTVHQLVDPKLGPGSVSRDLMNDMLRGFPPCRVSALLDRCKTIIADPDPYIGTAGLDWVGGSSKMIVMAEVTPSSSMGGIAGEVLGYEIEVPSGKILRRMEAKEFARKWQHSMAWQFQIPGPPTFDLN